MNLSAKVFIVTGAGSGIGQALTQLMIEKNAIVAGVDINEKSLNETKSSLPAPKQKNFSIHVLSIDEEEKISQLASKIIELHGQLDGIINNAGIIQPFVKINDLSMNDIKKVMNINFYGTLYLIKACLPYLIKREESLIMNISSMGGFLPVPGQAVYGASKAAVKLLTEALYAELLNSPVHVSVVFPGAVATNITSNSGVEVPSVNKEAESKYKALPVKKAAEIIVDGIEKNKARIFVGSDSKMMDILYRINPLFAIKFIAKQMKDLLNN